MLFRIPCIKLWVVSPDKSTIIGAVILPLTGVLPDCCLIVASGALGTVAEAQDNITVGVGALAGSTVMLLTIPWTGKTGF